jgi:hypothetical protein
MWRARPGLLMGAYFLLSLVVGPVFFVRVGTDASSALLSGSVLSAFFAWRVTRGGRISRMLLIVAAGTGVIAAVIMLAVRFSWVELRTLAACGGQIALLLSPAVYERTRPAGRGTRTVALWRRRRPALLVAALAAGAVLGLAGVAASAAVISGRIRGYDSDTVRVLTGHPVRVTLSPGGYSAFGGCVDEWGCAQLSARDLPVSGALSGPLRLASYGGFDASSSAFEERTDDGQPFVRELAFTVPVQESVRIALNVKLRQSVLVAPSEGKTGTIRGGIVAATGCALLLLGSLAGLAWPRRRS